MSSPNDAPEPAIAKVSPPLGESERTLATLIGMHVRNELEQIHGAVVAWTSATKAVSTRG